MLASLRMLFNGGTYRRGPSVEPWEIPQNNVVGLEHTLPTNTKWVQPVRNELKHCKAITDIPHCAMVGAKQWWSIVSKAVLKSSSTNRIPCFLPSFMLCYDHSY